MADNNGCIDCGHRGMKVGPTLANGRRTIELATDAWSEVPLPPMPNSLTHWPSWEAPTPDDATHLAGGARRFSIGRRRPNLRARFITGRADEPVVEALSLIVGHALLGDGTSGTQWAHLAESAVGESFGNKSLADLRVAIGEVGLSSLGLKSATVLPVEEEQPRADGEFVQMCASTVRHQRVVDVTYLEETAHGVEVTGDELQWRIAYYRKEAELKRADPGWRQLTAKDLAEWMDSPDWQAALESAVSRLFNPQCKPPCIPVTKTHGLRLLSYGSDVYSESHPASAEEKAMLEELLKEKGERLGPSDHPVAFVVGILHHFYYLVDATVDCLPISSA